MISTVLRALGVHVCGYENEYSGDKVVNSKIGNTRYTQSLKNYSVAGRSRGIVLAQKTVMTCLETFRFSDQTQPFEEVPAI